MEPKPGFKEITLTNQISRLQNKAVRMINFKRRDAPVDELYKSTNVLKISDQVNLLNALFTHDALLKKLPTSFENFVKKSVHLSNTRYTTIVHNEDTLQLDTLHLPHVKTIHSGQESVKYRSICTWNSFQTVFNDIPLTDHSKLHLRYLIKKHYLTQYSVTDEP